MSEARDQRGKHLHLINICDWADTRVEHLGLEIAAGACTAGLTWLQGQIPLDDKGFVRTGSAREDAAGMYETGRPGVFAVGDVRSGSVKRVASAVGEGAIAVRQVHDFLGTAGRR